ncbi:MAG: hypothetical protein ACRBCJ_01940 [Hyphomicrobiaceae bacterium]
MSVRKAFIFAPIMCAGLLAGCASDTTGLLSTSSIETNQKVAAAPKINPACVTLASQIDALRKEGTPERIKAVASGKSPTANIKRSALAKITELNAANAAFQQKCSTLPPKAVALTAVKPTASTAEKVTSVSKTATTTSSKAKAAVSNVAAKADKAATVVDNAKKTAAVVTAQ